MKNILACIGFVALSSIPLESNAQCLQPVCENLPATITANVVAPAPGVIYEYDWSIPIAFTGQNTAQIQITDVGAGPAQIPYTVTVLNTTTNCETIYPCTLDVGSAVPVVLTIPNYCIGALPFDIAGYVQPPTSILSGPGVTGTIYDPGIGGPVTATPPPGSGCLIASNQTPVGENPPEIQSTTVTQ